MAETVLPGVSIEVRDEGLIVPLGVTVGNLGVVGTASKGPVGVPTLVGSYGEARDVFGDYDTWQQGTANELTLVRALELAYRHGASTVFAVRVASPSAQQATLAVAAGGGVTAIHLEALSAGTWGNDVGINVSPAAEGAFVTETIPGGPAGINLARKPDPTNARNRVRVKLATGPTRVLTVVPPAPGPAPAPGEVAFDDTSKKLVFHTGEDPATASDVVTVSYVVPTALSRKVTLQYGNTAEVYTVADGRHLQDLLAAAPSVLATGSGSPVELANLPQTYAATDELHQFGHGADTPGSNGEDASSTLYDDAFGLLLNEEVHLMVAAGQDDTTYGAQLKGHCESASSDTFQHERIGIIGSKLGATFDQIRGHHLDSPRIVFVAPGIVTSDAPSGQAVTLPGAYAAAAIAGMLSVVDPQVSLTNKVPSVADLEQRFNLPQLAQLVEARVLALEEQRGQAVHVVKAITTSTNTAWAQVTTRRIVDYASYGVRSAAKPFIGRLNNERVRGALRTAINSLLVDMVSDEMLISYDLNVSATRDQEIKGIVTVTMVLRPVFSIDFIQVVIFLQ
jgi:hypothetical protein